MKPERKDEIKRACEAATKEPWFAWMSPSDVHEVNTGLAGNPVICKVGKSTQAEANADFIALARSALPEAMAEIERLEKKLQSQLCTMKTVRDFIADDLPYVAQNILEATLEAADAPSVGLYGAP